MSLFDDYEFDPYGDEQSVTCERCGEEELDWHYSGVRWRLIDADGNFHVCNNDNAVDDFEVLE